MRILAIDPGNVQSGWVVYDPCGARVVDAKIEDNATVRMLVRVLTAVPDTVFAIEQIRSYGMSVGQTVFDTCVWSGRFVEAWESRHRRRAIWIPRKEVCMHICNSSRAKDANIRQAIIDRFPATGGGKTPQVGTKKQPGPLYKLPAKTTDKWAAMALAITAAETVLKDEAA